MKRERILVLVLAGGEGGRLGPLTEKRAKPAVSFGGTLRLIDFALSNCLHSQMTDVWVIEQYQLHSLNDHLANGRPWDLDRTYGGLQVLPPSVEGGDDDGDGESEKSGKKGQGGFAKGNADAIYRQRQLIREFGPDLVLVMSSDHVYKLDYRDVVERHRACGAGVTMVTTQVPAGDDASRYGVVQTGDNGQVTAFAYKPKHPQGDRITAEVFLYETATLLNTLEEIAADGGELKDYGNELLPRLVKAGKAWEFRLGSYWRDVGTIESYWQGHMDLLASKSELGLDAPGWPILTYGAQKLPAHVLAGAQIEDSLLSPGCTVAGTVRRSVLAPDAYVAAGATVEDSVLLHGARVEGGAFVRKGIVDENAIIGARAQVGGEDEPTVIGSRAKVAPESTVPPGEHVDPK